MTPLDDIPSPERKRTRAPSKSACTTYQARKKKTEAPESEAERKFLIPARHLSQFGRELGISAERMMELFREAA